MVASDDPKEYDDRLTDFSGRIKSEIARDEDQEAAKKAVAAGRKKLREWKAARGPKRAPLLTELKGFMQQLYTLMGHPDVPESIVEFSPGKVWARPLTRKAGKIKGDESTSKFLFAGKQKGLNLVLNVWRTLHMLSARLHGPNQHENFILGTQSANSMMFSDAEDLTLKDLEAGKGKAVLWYETSVTPWPAPDDYAAKKIVIRRGTWDVAKDKEGPEKKPAVKVESDQPSLVIGAIDIHKYGREVIAEVGLGGVEGSEGVARSIVRLVELEKGFDTWGEFDAAVKRAPSDELRAGRQTILDLVFEARNATPKRLKLK
jgi:hypothetical protein